MLICLYCGETFKEEDVKDVCSNLGERGGSSISQDESACPYCLGSYSKAEKCERCGMYFVKGDLDENGLCENCAK